jgi:hypothetical protein
MQHMLSREESAVHDIQTAASSSADKEDVVSKSKHPVIQILMEILI